MVKEVLLVFKTHLDIGYTDYADLPPTKYYTKLAFLQLKPAKKLKKDGNPSFFIISLPRPLR